MTREIARMIQDAMARRIVLDAGTVTRVDWAGQRVRVRLNSSGQESGWLAIALPSAAARTPIRSGDSVMVGFMDGRPGAGFVLGVVGDTESWAEQAFGWAQGQKRVIFDAQGKVTATVSALEVTADGTASIDGTSVVLGGGVSAATKFEELSANLMPWAITLTTVLAALGITVPPPDVTTARAAKVKVG